MSGSRFAAFSSRGFRRYFLAQIVAQTGLWFQTLTVALVVAERTGNAFALSGVAIATFAPTLAWSWVAGRASDRWSPRRILIASTVVIGLVSPAMIIVLTAPVLELVPLYTALAVFGSASTFARVSAQALVYELVGEELLQNASIWASVMVSTARIAGPGLAGATLALVGEAGSLLVNTGFALVAATLVATISERELFPRRERAAGSIRVSDPAHALSRSIIAVIVLNGVVSLVAMNVAVTLTSIVSFELDGDAAALGITHTLNAIGAVFAGFLLTRVRHMTAIAVALGAIAFALSQLLLAAPAELVPFLLLTPILGLGLGLYQSGLMTAVQTGTPPALLGRAMSLVNLTSFGPLPLGAVLIGFLIETLGARGALAASGVLCLVTAAVMIVLMRRILRSER